MYLVVKKVLPLYVSLQFSTKNPPLKKRVSKPLFLGKSRGESAGKFLAFFVDSGAKKQNFENSKVTCKCLPLFDSGSDFSRRRFLLSQKRYGKQKLNTSTRLAMIRFLIRSLEGQLV